ncbi:MAG: PAS domain-containing protein [Acidobacteriota bacterium]|nr:PAS domain-containing protein [Acidobacteriota bacterium]MDQ3420252.1 PAS domain-containing protein [Acidobacteriota bacterium]
MNTIESLSIRTTAARIRLVELERRVEKASASGAVVKPALKELSAAIEELQVANEQLSQHVDELAASRHDVAAMTARHEEFIDVLPLPCIWTDEHGAVDQANEATAALLNVAARRLGGKPLSLFVSDRSAFFDAISQLRADPNQTVEIAVQIRPRERRPRQMRLTGHRLRHDQRLCWILRDDSDAVPILDAIAEPASAVN